MRKVIFEDGKSFNLEAGTVEGQRVSLFLCSETWEHRWRLQCEIQKIEPWMRGARPEDVIALHGLVAEESGLEIIYVDPFFACLAEHEIIKGLYRLSLVQLQSLTAMLYSAGEQAEA